MKNLAKVLLQYQSKWVALDKDRKGVIAASASLTELSKKTKKIREPVVIQYVVPIDKALAPLCLNIA